MRAKTLHTIAIQILFLFAFLNFELHGQSDNVSVKDKYNLLTMPYNQRPLQLYRGQLQFNTGFLFDIRTQIFDDEGNNLRKKTDGVTSVGYHFPFEIKYGVTNFIEIAASSSYARTGVPSKTIGYFGPDYLIYVYPLEELRGMTDLLVSASLRLPVEYKHVDLSLGGGVYIPTAAYRPEQPQHTVAERELSSGGTEYTFHYRYTFPNGAGVPVYRLTAAGKLSLQQFSLQANSIFMFPAKSGTNIRWMQSLANRNSFVYTSEEYGYLPNRSLSMDVTAHYQVNGWFDVYMCGAYFSSSDGWTEYYKQKYANPKQELWIVEPGFAIQVSPNFILYQKITLPVSGKNIDGRFQVSVTASFNLFPFFKEDKP